MIAVRIYLIRDGQPYGSWLSQGDMVEDFGRGLELQSGDVLRCVAPDEYDDERFPPRKPYQLRVVK